MAKKSEQFQAELARQRSAKTSRAGAGMGSKPGTPLADRTRDKKHAARKATYALELSAPATTPSRKSTRKSANRSKPDTGFNLREMLLKGSPEARFARTAAQRTTMRGKPL